MKKRAGWLWTILALILLAGPAGHSRIMPGDCLTRIEDVSVNSIDLLDQCIRESTASRLCFYYLHNGHEEYFTVLVRR